MDKYGYIGIETLLNYCENSKEHAVTPNEFMRMNRVRMPEQQWIPVTERLPEEDVEVLITYRYKEGEGDTSHAYIDITTYGQMYFGGNKVGDHKHWRQPFEYFTSNYEVVAWMPLPEPYKGEQE